MTVEEILAGESKNVEFKENLPEKSIKYMKSVVAFSNGMGGKILFGIADKTREVVGIDQEDVFKTMDAITNAISDSCEPAIIPDITLQTIDGKTIIVVEIPAGRQRPYYIKSLGRDNGVYVRVAGTTRLADEFMIKELLFEGSSRCFDQMLCTGLEITEDDVIALCRSMKEQAVQNAQSAEQKGSIKDVTKQQLLSWGILIEKEGHIYPANAYAILTGNDRFSVTTQCGVFKGTTKAIFIDRREYTGPVWEQIEQAYQFVLRNIHMGATFAGLYRQDVYEIPPDAIRELIINAAVHRSYLEHGSVQVAIYDDRLEITSPGKLPMGQTLERMKEGYSKIRNEALACAFSYMNLIEHWGSGIPRIIEKVNAAGLREPEFVGGDVDLRINIYRGQAGASSEKQQNTIGEEPEEHRSNIGEDAEHHRSSTREPSEKLTERERHPLNDTQKKILELLRKDCHLSAAKMSEEIGVASRTIESNLKKLKDLGIIIRYGSPKQGYWEITDDK